MIIIVPVAVIIYKVVLVQYSDLYQTEFLVRDIVYKMQAKSLVHLSTMLLLSGTHMIAYNNAVRNNYSAMAFVVEYLDVKICSC